ncbi:hypothetical protein C8R42DRAFT_656269 [Lentinula raphanica]|nr:hypothetical protein C8R42DRAFT_656269 [Lentinula raphanica]
MCSHLRALSLVGWSYLSIWLNAAIEILTRFHGRYPPYDAKGTIVRAPPSTRVGGQKHANGFCRRVSAGVGMSSFLVGRLVEAVTRC